MSFISANANQIDLKSFNKVANYSAQVKVLYCSLKQINKSLKKKGQPHFTGMAQIFLYEFMSMWKCFKWHRKISSGTL